MSVSTAIYALAHFAVDLGCAYVLFSGNPAGATGFLLYNFFAFAMQMPLGLLADRLGRGRWFAVLGTALVLAVKLLPGLAFWSVCLLGLGNALFHIGGGVDVLHSSGSHAAPLGIFVSPGAFGIYLGAVWGNGQAPGWPVLVLLTVSLLLMLTLRSADGAQPAAVVLPDKSLLPWAGLLFLVVVLRSYGGMAGSYSWKTGLWIPAAVMAVVMGKACGGLAADRLGPEKTSALSLLLAAGCFLLGGQAVFGLLALFLFHMTMPITLFALARAMPGCRGFSFGLLTFALFLGFLPSYLGAGTIGPVAIAAVSAASLLMLLPGLGHTLPERKE